MYNAKRRVLCLLLAMLLTLPFAGCSSGAGGGEKESETVGAESAENTETETETETEAVISDDLPESDFEGYTYMIYNANPESNDWFTTVFVTMEEDSGDAVPSAIFQRNVSVEDRLNIKIEESYQTGTQIKNAIVAADGNLDMSLMQGADTLALSRNGFLLDLYSLPYQNFDKPWWDSNAASQLSLCGRLFMGVGDFLTTPIDETICTFFNKNIVDDHQLEDPYALVRDGKWTIDKLGEMGLSACQDVNGDGVYDDNDDYGLLSWRGVLYCYLIYGSGNTITQKNAEDVPEFAFNAEPFIGAFEKVVSICHANGDTFLYDAEMKNNTKGLSNNHRVQEIMFPGNQSLFWVECISWSKALRDMEANFGILPCAKYDESQAQYYNYNNGNFFGISVPATVSDQNRTSIILEALNSMSANTVRAAYYDTMLKTKYSRDEDSADMVDIIFDTQVYDCSVVFGIGNAKTNLYTMASKNNADIASFYQKQSGTLSKNIEKLVTDYAKLGE